jgi:cytidine deaminase
MKKQRTTFSFDVYDSIDALPQNDAFLLKMAKDATATAYAPYSHFHVGAAAELGNGNFIKGTNQENASYPVGICAERVLLSAVAAQYPGTTVKTMAISYDNRNGESITPIAPCGMCRQALLEFEDRQQHPIRLVLGGMQGKVYVIEQANMLLPLSFKSENLK